MFGLDSQIFLCGLFCSELRCGIASRCWVPSNPDFDVTAPMLRNQLDTTTGPNTITVVVVSNQLKPKMVEVQLSTQDS